MENQEEVRWLLGKNQEINLRKYPDPLIDLPPGPDGQMLVFSKGDIHANPIMLLHMLVKHKLIVMKPERYARLVALYDRQWEFSQLLRDEEKREEQAVRKELIEAWKGKPEELTAKIKDLEVQYQARDQEVKALDKQQQAISKKNQEQNTNANDDPEFQEVNNEKRTTAAAREEIRKEQQNLQFVQYYVKVQEGDERVDIGQLQIMASALQSAIQGSNDPKEKEQWQGVLERIQPLIDHAQEEPRMTLEIMQQMVADSKLIQNAALRLHEADPNRKKILAAIPAISKQYSPFIEYSAVHRFQELGSKMRAELMEFRNIVRGVEVPSPFFLRLLGDDICDRGATDASVLSTMRELAEKNPHRDLLLSDHDIHFIEFIETDNRDAILKFNLNGQANSGATLLKFLDLGIVTMDEIRADYQTMYHDHLKAIGYELSPDKSHITLHAHAPIDWEVVEAMANFHGVPYRDQTPEDRAYTIDAINEAFRENYVRKDRVHELNRVPRELKVKFEQRDPEVMRYVKAHHPHYFSIWHNEVPGKEVLNRPTHDEHGNTLSYTHGHTHNTTPLEHVAVLDVNTGKPGCDVGESPVTVAHATVALTVEEKRAIETKWEAREQQEAFVEARIQKAGKSASDPNLIARGHLETDLKRAIRSQNPGKMLAVVEKAKKNSQFNSKEMKRLLEGMESCAKSLMEPAEISLSQAQLNQIYSTVVAGNNTQPHPFKAVLTTIPQSKDASFRFAHSGTVAETKKAVIKALNAESRSAQLSKAAAVLSFAVSRIGEVFKPAAQKNPAVNFQSLKGELRSLKQRVADIEDTKAQIEGREAPVGKTRK